MPRRGQPKNGHGAEHLTRAQVEAMADRTARKVLGVSKEEAFEKLDRGELRGTVAEAELSSLRWLMHA